MRSAILIGMILGAVAGELSDADSAVTLVGRLLRMV
jgi:hypothetical protein